MNMDVTHSVISDLWPLYTSGEASPETRTLVEAFLASDPGFARTLQESHGMMLGTSSGPVLPPDHELQTLAKIKRGLRGYPWLLQLAILFSAMAFGRIVSDTSWDVSPRNFIIMASFAAVFWIAFFASLIRNRARILVVSSKRNSR